MVRSRFKFGDFDGLMRKCLDSVPRYCQVYPTARPGVSISLEEMITKGFPSNENIVWHKATQSEEILFDHDLRILPSTNKCREIVHQSLVRWSKTSILPVWKTIWTVFNIANYDINERRIKAIHKVIQDHITREALNSNDASCSDIESINGRLSYEDHFDHDNQDDEQWTVITTTVTK
ncbi:unnamed protein product [Rotaria sordida]|uniref:Uncharacterized protein n=1 Tax=Rotaria sordida TaxID=392033 RepID=A0A814QQD6_9BILA|nr:unnamed protein product [Rotaria sordida]CAF1601546.1 unnamed protein product [Rotaria sordida]